MSHRKKFWTWTTVVSLVGGLSIFYVASGQALTIARKFIAVLDTPAQLSDLRAQVVSGDIETNRKIDRIMVYLSIPTNGLPTRLVER